LLTDLLDKAKHLEAIHPLKPTCWTASVQQCCWWAEAQGVR
jgi:hypothetical protein